MADPDRLDRFVTAQAADNQAPVAAALQQFFGDGLDPRTLELLQRTG